MSWQEKAKKRAAEIILEAYRHDPDRLYTTADEVAEAVLRGSLPLIEVTPGMENTFYEEQAKSVNVFAPFPDTMKAVLTACTKEGTPDAR